MPFVRRHDWRSVWLRLASAGITALLTISPIAVRFLQTPQAVIGRSGATASTAFDLGNSVQGLIDQIWNAGDENPQYNVAQAPIVAPIFMPLLLIGLVALLWRWRSPSSLMLAALLVLTSLPSLLSDEVNHGLRTVGLAATLALIIGLGTALILRWLQRTPIQYTFSFLLLLGVPLLAIQSWQVYRDYWLQADHWKLWRIHGRELNHNEWFFRIDQRELAAWISQQKEALLLPVEALNQPTLRAWLARSHPQVSIAEADFVDQPSSMIVLPYNLERDSFLPTASHYALLHEGKISIFPPFDRTTQVKIAQSAEIAQLISGAGRISPIASVMPTPPKLVYEDWQPAHIVYAHPIRLTAWAGDNWQEDGIFSVVWQADSTLAHEYFTYLQILDQDYRVVAQAQDTQALRWLYPSTLWPSEQPVPVSYSVPLQALDTGAYRLIIGAYPIFQQPLQAFEGAQALLFPQVAWLKVAHGPLSIPDEAFAMNEVFDQIIELISVNIRQEDQSLQVDLYWRSLIDRPNLDATIFVHALDNDATIIAQQDTRPQDGRYPTFIWDVGEIVHTHHNLQVKGAAHLRIGLYEFVDGALRNLPARDGEALLLDSSLWR